MTELVTMKMIRSTRKISVSGVMLISAMMAPSENSSAPVLMATRAALHARKHFDDLLALDLDQENQAVPAGLKRVIGHDRDHRDDDAGRGGDQRFGDPGRDHCKTARARARHLLEGSQNPDDRTEETDERSSAP